MNAATLAYTVQAAPRTAAACSRIDYRLVHADDIVHVRTSKHRFYWAVVHCVAETGAVRIVALRADIGVARRELQRKRTALLGVAAGWVELFPIHICNL